MRTTIAAIVDRESLHQRATAATERLRGWEEASVLLTEEGEYAAAGLALEETIAARAELTSILTEAAVLPAGS